ncbi:GNAT family N-acetyltransferase [Neptunicella sp. SCSIO 80796]|uniref:GNAT family N-acetyltransferase n=1 Tax=Neptunicella plasticusilytica TaxID=3117012 RepID=UPI003A4DD979
MNLSFMTSAELTKKDKPTLDIRFIHHIDTITVSEFNQLEHNQSPFLDHGFFLALEQQYCVGADSGWLPRYLTAYENGRLLAFAPCYIKTHSYGEYVFDFAWAEAYQRHKLNYYPKLLAAIPFTPVPGQRLISSKPLSGEQTQQIFDAIDGYLQQHGLSSMHWLFVAESQLQSLQQAGYVLRKSVQFHWFNHDYQSFDDFLALCTSRKRKSIKRERKRVVDAQVEVTRIDGQSISEQEMHYFYQCYQSTYLKRSGHAGYLSEGFFQQLRQSMPDKLMLVLARQHTKPVAAALFLHDQSTLYGRYWGCLQEIDALHFECCFYQGIEYCIANRLELFNPGTQGEHKILRGFEPVWCYSAHKLTEPAFHDAVAHFVVQESSQLALYKQQAQSLLPYKTAPTD